MAKFEKGHKLSTGRPKGSVNKVSKEIREVSAMILQGEIETLKERLKSLNDSDYIKAIGLLFKYCVPQQQQIALDVQQEQQNITVEIIDRLEQVTNEEVEEAIFKQADESLARIRQDNLNNLLDVAN